MAKTINLDTSQRVDVICKKGDTFDLSLTLKDSETLLSMVNDTASPAADADQFKMEVRDSDENQESTTDAGVFLSTEHAGSKKIFVKDSTGTDFTTTSVGQASTDGIVRFFVPADDMKSIPSGLYVYDIEIDDFTSQKTSTLIYGTFKVNEDISI